MRNQILASLSLLLAEILILAAAIGIVTTGYAGRPWAIVALFGSLFGAVVFVAVSNFAILGIGANSFGWLRAAVGLLLLVGCALTLFPIWDVIARTR